MRNYDAMIPPHLLEAMRAWVLGGRAPGDFLQAVLRNDLKETFLAGDETSLAALPAIVEWFYQVAPGACWGSDKKCLAWREGGFDGLPEWKKEQILGLKKEGAARGNVP